MNAKPELFHVNQNTFTREQARDLLPDLVGFVNRNGLLDDYTGRVAKRVDPSHVHEYRLASILQNYEGPNKDGFHMRGFCWKCWAQLDIDLECSGGSIDSEIHEITERAWGKGKGLYAFQVSEQTLYLRKLVQLFPGDK